MQLRHPCNDILSFPNPVIGADGCVATIGFFDGVHQGHRFLLEKLTTLAKEKSLPSVVLSFWPHPQAVLGKSCPQLLTDCAEKVALINRCGVDHIVILPFDISLSQLSAYGFMEKVLRDTYHVKYLLMGYDHRFGHRGETTEVFEDYRRFGESLGIEVLHAEAMSANCGIVGSSTIREALLRHDIETANDALGYPYTISGHVERGFENGHKLGFPTANVVPDSPEKLVPANGVYAVEVMLESKRDGHDQIIYEGPYQGMLNIGCRPTLQNGEQRSIEVNIFDFNGDIYGCSIQISLRHFVREEQAFNSTESLSDQLKTDRDVVRSLLKKPL